MARKATASKAKADKAEKAPAAEAPKYGVPELAEALGIIPASVRVKLRKSDFEKTGRAWGWDTKKDFDEVVKSLKAADKAEAKSEDAGEEKPKRGRRKKAA